jgi:hypothetical protein
MGRKKKGDDFLDLPDAEDGVAVEEDEPAKVGLAFQQLSAQSIALA